MSRFLPLLSLTACAPLMGGAMPAPLPSGHVAAAGIGVAAPVPGLITAAGAEGVALPRVQGVAWGTFQLAHGWDAGPIFVLAPGPEAQRFTTGFFARRWLREDPEGLSVGLRADLGWAWAGFAADLVAPISEDLDVVLSPGLVGTPELVAARVPLGVLLRLRSVGLGVELGVGGSVGRGGPRAGAYGGLRAQIAF